MKYFQNFNIHFLVIVPFCKIVVSNVVDEINEVIDLIVVPVTVDEWEHSDKSVIGT